MAAKAAGKTPRKGASNKPQIAFQYKLVLNQWLLSLFHASRFEELAEHLRSEALEGLDENNIHYFHHELAGPLFNLTEIPTELLLEYDQNIVKHTQLLNERRSRRREPELTWKYFQYLTLLFTEIYLDHYFRDPEALRAALNARVAIWNGGKPEADWITPLDETGEAWTQLNKIAFWMATGSGKTLLMHANIGLPDDDNQLELVIPVLKNLGTQKLKTIRLKKTINGVSTEFGDAFRKLAPIPTLRLPDVTSESENRWLRATRVEVNWYPRIQAMKSQGTVGGDAESHVNTGYLSPKHIAFLDLDRIWFELERFKAERSWYNFNVPRSAIAELLDDRTWYDLLIPKEELAFDSFERVRQWEEIAIALLKDYMKRFYRFAKREWEEPHLEYQELTENDPNFLRLPESMQIKDGPNEGYRILIDRSEEEIIQKLMELKELILRGELKPFVPFRGIHAIQFAQHLYQPLLYLEKKIIEVMPVALNEGEYRFVEDIKKYYEANPQRFQDRELYLLRNLSRGRGVGFFEAGNFHPDFILWVVTGGRQHVTFVDPKGIRNLGPNDDKLRFHKTVKGIEERLGDPNVVLDSFIVSNTPSAIMQGQWGIKKAQMIERHIVFQNEDHETYVGHILNDL